jgi:O-antigen ligase
MASRLTARLPTGSRAALVVLVALVVVSPWPFGCAHPVARWLLTLACLGTALGVGILRLWRREGLEAPLPVVLIVGVCVFGFLQLVPVPRALHALVAPGSAALWHPEAPQAAAVLGGGFHPISIWPEATRRGVAFALGLVFLAVLSMPALRDRRRLLRASVAVVASGLAVAVYGLVARLAFPEKLYGVLAVPTIAPFGPFVSKNHFAGYVELTALLGLGLAAGLGDEARRSLGAFGWIGSRRAPRVVFAYATVAVLSLAVLVSLSRGGAASLAVGIAAFATLRWSNARTSRRRWRPFAVVAAALVAAFIGTYLVLPPEARQRLHSIAAWGEDSSTSFRSGIWGDALRTAAASPLLGYGFGTFVDALPRYKTGAGGMIVEHAENDYLELLTDSGVIGFALILGAVVALGIRSRFDAAPGVSPLRRALVQGSTAGLLALAVHSLVDFNLRIPSNGLLVAFLAAVVLGSCPESRERRGATAALVGLGALALLMAAPAPSSPRVDTAGVTSLSHSQLPITRLRLRQVEDELQRFVSARPGDAEAWVWLGWSRASSGWRDEGSALAAYGASLDPQRDTLRLAAEQIAR